MFNTFAVAEADWNNEFGGRPKIPKGPAMYIYSWLTFNEMFKALQTAKASPDMVAALNQRVSGGIHVPRDFDTLQEAVDFLEQFPDSKPISLPEIRLDGDDEHRHNNDPNIVTIPRKIIVGEGEHQIDGDYLWIHTAVSIVGDPKEKRDNIDVIGGIRFVEGIQENCHLQHLSLRQAKRSAVVGKCSFTMDDVLVEQCGEHGVTASGTGVVGRCTNVEVRQCGMSGVYAHAASITLIGAKTTVHHNCTKGQRGEYGLQVSWSSATIQLVSPLTKEQVSIDNGGGGNWGARLGADINQITTIPTLVELMAKWRIKSDVVVALQELGVEAPSDILNLTNSDIEKFIVDTKLKRVEANRFRKGVKAMVAAASSTM
tara:strand:- start:293 stop:1408 length:1116 start_codon:yes stop_codon:yes gene_type:complete